MFTEEGTFNVTVTATCLAESKFCKDDENAFDVCLEVEGEEGQKDWWRGEYSNRYGIGNASDTRQREMTMKVLTDRLGLPDGDLSRLNELVGKKTTATVKASKPDANDKVYYNVKYLGDGSSNPKAAEISVASVAARIAALNGGGSSFAQPATQQAATPAQPTAQPAAPAADSDNLNPFA